MALVPELSHNEMDERELRKLEYSGELHEIFVKFLPHWVSEKDVRGIFAECGEIVHPGERGRRKWGCSFSDR